MKYKGRIINGYRIQHKLGAGGMGEVYLAHHEQMGRKAAVKILFQNDMADRFRNEAYIQSNVSHPNLTRLYEYSSIEGQPCIIMEHINGPNLDEWILESSDFKNSDQIRHIFKQICEGVRALHQKGIQHRDLKPSNIKITKTGVVKLLDFGIAKVNYTPKLTKEGFLVGTTDFMAPEQFNGTNSIASDLWSLGVLLYFMLSKKLPFDHKSIVTQRRNIRNAQYTSINKVNGKLSSKFSKLIQQCLQVNPKDRPSISQILALINEDNPHAKARNSFKLPTTISQIPRYTYWIAGIILMTLIWQITPKSTPQEDTMAQDIVVLPTIDSIEVVVQNTRQVKLITANNIVFDKPPFLLAKTRNKPLEIELIEGKYSMKITIPASFNKDRFICNMNY